MRLAPTRRALLAAAFAMMLAPATAQEAGPLVAAAATLQFALPEIIEAHRAAGGGPVRATFGATGALDRQIRSGAPFELFMAADDRFIAQLHADGLTEEPGAPYALGRIALLLPPGSPLKPDGTLADLKAALADGRLRRFAIASPVHAPYGMRAEEALRAAGVWEAIQPKLVVGENVSQAAAFALSGSTQGGLVSLSLASAPDVAARGTHVPVPETMHSPLVQSMALVKGAGPEAVAFRAFLETDAARSILRRHGLEPPGAGS